MSDAGSGKLQVAAAVRDCDRRRLLFYAPGAFAAISLVGFLSFDLGYTLLIASFGASAVILFGMPDSAAARPMNVFFGHTASAVIAMVVYSLMGLTWLSLAIGVVSALVVMSLTDTMHPPGGATVIACMTSNPSWSFVLMPVAAGALALIAISVLTGLVYRRMSRQEDVGSPTCDLGPPISPRGP